MRKLLLIPTAALVAAITAAPAAAAGLGPPHDAFYVDGPNTIYRTIGTPTDLSGTGAPASTFDALYAIEGQAIAVAEAKPGDADYNGGRWMRFQVTWNIPVEDRYLLTSAEAVVAAASGATPDVTIASQPDAQFVCPVIR
jgi:hypothetical protein